MKAAKPPALAAATARSSATLTDAKATASARTVPSTRSSARAGCRPRPTAPSPKAPSPNAPGPVPPGPSLPRPPSTVPAIPLSSKPPRRSPTALGVRRAAGVSRAARAISQAGTATLTRNTSTSRPVASSLSKCAIASAPGRTSKIPTASAPQAAATTPASGPKPSVAIMMGRGATKPTASAADVFWTASIDRRAAARPAPRAAAAAVPLTRSEVVEGMDVPLSRSKRLEARHRLRPRAPTGAGAGARPAPTRLDAIGLSE